MTRITAIKRDSVHTLERLECDLRQREAASVAKPDGARYSAWQHALCKLSVFRVDRTQKPLLTTAQRIFEHGDKNRRL